MNEWALDGHRLFREPLIFLWIRCPSRKRVLHKACFGFILAETGCATLHQLSHCSLKMRLNRRKNSK